MRLPELSTLAPEKLKPFYTTLEALYEDYPILLAEPWRIQNLDETSKTYDSHQATGIFRRGQKDAHVRTSGNREHASWLIHVNAAGEVYPPNVIFPGGKSARVDPDLLRNAPEGTVAWFSSNGWMEEEHFHRYITEVAYPRLLAAGEVTAEKPVVIVFDGHKSHVGNETIRFCIDHHVKLVTLPPHSSDTTQPLDVSNFKPLWTAYRKEYGNYQLDAPDASIDRATMLQIFRPAFYKAFTRPNIKSGFRKTGIYPFNPDIVLKNPDNFMRKEADAPEPTRTQAADGMDGDESALGSSAEGSGAEAETEDVAQLLLQMRSEYPEINLAEAEEAAAQTEGVSESEPEADSVSPQQNGEARQAAVMAAEEESRAGPDQERSQTNQPRLTVPGLDPVQDQVLRLPPPQLPKPKRVTENAVVNASRLLTDPVLLALKEQLAQEKAGKQRQAEERKRLAEEKKRLKEQEEEEKREKARKRKEEQAAKEEQQKREAEEKARRKAEEKAAREEQKRREEEEKARREEEKRRAREEKKRQEEEEKERRAEERRAAQEEKKKRDEEERARKKEEDRIAREERRKKADEEKERKREADRLKREEKRRKEAEQWGEADLGTCKPAARRKRSARKRQRFARANLGWLPYEEVTSSEQSESGDEEEACGGMQQAYWPHMLAASLEKSGGPVSSPLAQLQDACLGEKEKSDYEPDTSTWLTDLLQTSLIQASSYKESDMDSEETE